MLRTAASANEENIILPSAEYVANALALLSMAIKFHVAVTDPGRNSPDHPQRHVAHLSLPLFLSRGLM
jgi:hypothetical protein